MKWRVTFSLELEIDGGDKHDAKFRAAKLLMDMDAEDIAALVDDEPVDVVPLDDNGDPIV